MEEINVEKASQVNVKENVPNLGHSPSVIINLKNGSHVIKS
jgi:hypothetical protein